MIENSKGLGGWFALNFLVFLSFFFSIFLELSFNFKISQPKESPNVKVSEKYWKIFC